MKRSLLSLLIITIGIDFLVPVLIPVFNTFFLPLIMKPFLVDVFEVSLYILPTASAILSLIFYGVGAYLAYHVYRTQRYPIDQWMEKFTVLQVTHRVLFNRFYFDTFFQKLAEKVILASTLIMKFVENGMDMVLNIVGARAVKTVNASYHLIELEGLSQLPFKGFNELFNSLTQILPSLSIQLYSLFEEDASQKLQQGLLSGFQYFENMLRKLHTGIVSYNLLMVAIGLGLLLGFLVLFGLSGGG